MADEARNTVSPDAIPSAQTKTVIARLDRAIYRVVRQEVDHGRECGIVLAGQGDRCAAASPALTGCARRRIGWP